MEGGAGGEGWWRGLWACPHSGMFRITTDHPVFRDPAFVGSSTHADMRGTTVHAEGTRPTKNEVIKDGTQSETVGKNVSRPGASSSIEIGDSHLGTVMLGSDTLFELTHDLERRLDSGELPPVERSEPHALNHHFKSIGEERRDTGQLPVRLVLDLGRQINLLA